MLKTNLTGTTMVFRNDDKGFAIYTTTLGNKNKDGDWENASIELKFKKGIELENRAKINVLNGFLTFRTYIKDEKKKYVLYLFIMEFEEEGAESEPTPDGFTTLDCSIPF